MGPKRQATGKAPRPRKKRTKTGAGEFQESLSDVEDSSGPSRNRRNQIMIEDEDDDIQGGYEEADGHYLEDIFIPPKYVRIEPDQSGERLVIEKIVCENFKSYGGVKEMGPFHKSFSAIVGPNGNGKSNIIDAMLFVFGYRAAKIRCKKVSVLIHKSELLPALTCCAVTVHFVKIVDNGLNDDTFDVVPNSRITVMRRANSDNSSSYWYDGRKVNFQQVATFLKGNGIDIVHNRFLILQGEVESIAQMPPKTPNGLETGLLEFLEEVIGTKRYIKPLVDLEQRVEMLDYDREEKLHRVDLVEKEKQAMSEPVKKAKDFLRDQNSRSQCQHQILQFRNFNSSRKCDELNEKTAPVMEEVAVINSRLEEIKSINESRNSEFEKEEKQCNKIQAEHEKKKKNFEANEAEYVKHYENITRANEQRKKHQKDKVKKEKEIEKLDEIPRVSKGEHETMTKRKLELDQLIQAEEPAVKDMMDKLNEKINGVLKEKVNVDKDFNKWLPVRHEKSMNVEQIKRELENYKQKEKKENEKMELYVKELQELKADIDEREKQAGHSMETNIDELQKQLHQKQQELPVVVEDEANKRNELVNLASAIQEAKEVIEGSGVTDQIYKLFFEEKEQGRMQGLYGRLKDLATIEEKYNVAATVSSGSWEQWVVDHDNTATECIALLKKKNMPFQNFVCLNRLAEPARNMKNRYQAPVSSHRIFDLLNINHPETAPAFYKALRDTLVTDNLDIGSRIAYGSHRCRVATLRGDLIEPSGSMTGGGRSAVKGKMNSNMAAKLTSNVSRKDYDKLRKQYDVMNRDLQALSSRKSALESEIFALRNEIKSISDRAKNFQGDLEGLKKQLPFKQKRVKDQEKIAKESKVDHSILKQKEKALKAAELEVEEVIESSKDAETAVAKLNEKLQELQVSKKNEIRKKLDKFLHQRKLVEEDIDKIVVGLKNYEKNKKRALDKISSFEVEIEKLENSMRTWTQLRKGIEESSKLLKGELEEIATRLEEAKSELAVKKQVLNEFKDEEKKLAKKKVELDAKIEDNKKNLNELQNKIRQNKHQMRSLVLKEIPEEEVPPLTELSEEELNNFNSKGLENQLSKLEKRLQGESPNLNILEAYNKKIELFLERVEELDAVTARRDKFRDAFISTTAQRLAEFMEGFAVISSKLKEMFRMISMGGDAELDLVDSTDPFSSGVQFSVRPARKTWKKISNLSGGEKTLSSLALIFALHYFKPSPFYVMDEIDAALDFKNVSIIANYVKDRTKFTQFIIISLRSNMFELADSLLGVYKVDNMSYSIHIGVTKMLSTMKRIKLSEGAKPPTDSQATQKVSSQPPAASQQSTQPTLEPGSQNSNPSATESEKPVPSPAHTSANPVPVSNLTRENLEKQNGALNHSSSPIFPTPKRPSPRSGTRRSSGNSDSEMSVVSAISEHIGHPMSSSTPIRKDNPIRLPLEGIDLPEIIAEEDSRELRADRNENDSDSDEDLEQSQILSGESQERPKLTPGNFEFEQSSSDEESELGPSDDDGDGAATTESETE